MLNLTICAHVNSNQNPHIKITNFVRVLYQNTIKKKIIYSDSEFKNRISTKYMCVLDNRCVIMY